MSHAENDFSLGIRETRIRPNVYRQIDGKLFGFGTMNKTFFNKKKKKFNYYIKIIFLSEFDA